MDVKARGNICGGCIPARYILAVLGSIGMAIVYGLKVNLSVAMVGMLNHTALKPKRLEVPLTNVSSNETASNHEQDGPFVWSSDTQGIILSCYFWGYFASQFPGGRVAELFSAKWVMFLSVTINVVCTLLTPVMAELHYGALVCMRVLEGIGGGVTFPGMNVLLSKWSPPEERIVMSALVYTGTTLGTVISMLMAGILTYKAGWASSFYVMGGLSMIWCVLWVILVQDTPQKQPFISKEERHMIVSSLGINSSLKNVQKKIPVPWCAVFTSPPFYAILAAHTCSTWGWYLLLLDLPLYMKQVLHFNITQNTLSTALPFLTLWLFSIVLGKILDCFRSRGMITTTTARKIGTTISSIGPSVCLLALCFIGNHPGVAVTIMTLGITSTGGMFCGFLANHIDIAPNFAGTLMALTNTIASIPGIVVPLFVGAITHDNQTIHEWRIIFYVTIGMYIFGITTYLTFGSSEEQPWNKIKHDEELEVKPLNDEKKQQV